MYINVLLHHNRKTRKASAIQFLYNRAGDKPLHSKGLVTNGHDIEVQRKDPCTSPLYSAKSFEQLVDQRSVRDMGDNLFTNITAFAAAG